jgi:hypothetical protein
MTPERERANREHVTAGEVMFVARSGASPLLGQASEVVLRRFIDAARRFDDLESKVGREQSDTTTYRMRTTPTTSTWGRPDTRRGPVEVLSELIDDRGIERRNA